MANDPAGIYTGATCGFANAGQIVWLQNNLFDKPVRVTVRVMWAQGGNNGQFDEVHELPAGGKKQLRCSRDSTFDGRTYQHYVVGVQVL